MNRTKQINLNELEQEWRKSLPRLSDKESLAIFPEAKQTIVEKLKELEEIQKEIIEVIKKKLTIIKYRSDPENQWFWKEVVKVWEGQDLLEVDRQITRLKRLAYISKSKTSKKGITDEMIQQALVVPIESIASQHIQLRKGGKYYVGLCPFHNEKNPSFYIYPDTNSFYCYGCQKGGNIINFVELLYDFSFKETIRFLLNY